LSDKVWRPRFGILGNALLSEDFHNGSSIILTLRERLEESFYLSRLIRASQKPMLLPKDLSTNGNWKNASVR
jgi:hypothetical protein